MLEITWQPTGVWPAISGLQDLICHQEHNHEVGGGGGWEPGQTLSTQKHAATPCWELEFLCPQLRLGGRREGARSKMRGYASLSLGCGDGPVRKCCHASTHIKAGGRGARCEHSTGKAEVTGPWSLLFSLVSWLVSVSFNARPCLKIKQTQNQQQPSRSVSG